MKDAVNQSYETCDIVRCIYPDSKDPEGRCILVMGFRSEKVFTVRLDVNVYLLKVSCSRLFQFEFIS